MKSYQQVYNILVSERDYLSGEKIAESLNISRTAVWKAIQRLQQEGLEIDSIKNRGYKLIQGDLILPQEIEKRSPVVVQFKASTKSTQTDAKKAVEAGSAGDTLYLSTSQTAGRGRFHRPYFSPPQGGIYMSLHIKPNLPYDQLPAYTLLVAGAIYKAIKNLAMIDISIKWVNDIYLNQKKIAGILTEAVTSVETGLVTDIIIGVGLNFSIIDFPQDLKEKAGSLFTNGAPITRNDLISEVWKYFYETDHEELLHLYKQHSMVLGNELSFKQGEEILSGKATNISDKGELQIELANGKKIWLNSGEISLTKW